MREGLTEIVCILDRSGSMSNLTSEAIGGFNEFIKEQKEADGDANVTVALFDNNYKLLHDNVNINDVPELTGEQYWPGGMTALYDAIGMTVDNIGKRLSETKEEDRPENVIVAILTDGYENTSREYTAEKVKEMIEHQEEKYDWTFMYLAANQDAFDVGLSFGMKDYNSINFNATSGGTTGAFTNMSRGATSYRSVANKGLDKATVLYSANFVDADGNEQ